MNIIARLLNIRLGKYFGLESTDGKPNYYDQTKFKLEPDGLYRYDSTDKIWEKSFLLEDIVLGKFKIKQIQPVQNQVYYSYSDDWEIAKCVWQDRPIDFALYEIGFVFDTKRDALDAFRKNYEKYVGKKLETAEKVSVVI